MLENREEMIVFNLFFVFLPKLSNLRRLTAIQRERDRERAREGKEQTIDGQRQTQR